MQFSVNTILAALAMASFASAVPQGNGLCIEKGSAPLLWPVSQGVLDCQRNRLHLHFLLPGHRHLHPALDARRLSRKWDSYPSDPICGVSF
ncbi:hypothetical protein PG997_015121 [Apiospora hydei]|uniref:Uncharacterized protein n=1 Tax=Apiospora hydei TaxID=1337664 RepID=A0ABR1UVQ8_9PEZI